MIRIAKEKDIEEIWKIYTPYVKDSTVSFEYQMPSQDTFTDRFHRVMERFPWLVYELDGKIAGYAYAEAVFERKAYQWSADLAIYVEKTYQRNGIASQLYGCLEDILKEQGYINIYTLVTGHNEASARFHEAIGYRKLACFQKAGYKLGEWLDVIWFEKQVNTYPKQPSDPIAFPCLTKECVQCILDKANQDNG